MWISNEHHHFIEYVLTHIGCVGTRENLWSYLRCTGLQVAWEFDSTRTLMSWSLFWTQWDIAQQHIQASCMVLCWIRMPWNHAVYVIQNLFLLHWGSLKPNVNAILYIVACNFQTLRQMSCGDQVTSYIPKVGYNIIYIYIKLWKMNNILLLYRIYAYPTSYHICYKQVSFKFVFFCKNDACTLHAQTQNPLGPASPRFIHVPHDIIWGRLSSGRSVRRCSSIRIFYVTRVRSRRTLTACRRPWSVMFLFINCG